ncbi:MAG: helix-turn-helix domain-containing protein [Streptosporangiales bacterium]|nr:helix-turn-helix domain-containing protein [Streptosporangiales bacterium]
MAQSIGKAIQVLDILSDAPLTPSEVSRRLDAHRSTALRIMETLAEYRLIRKLPDGRYGIGAGLVAMAQRALDQFTLMQLAHPHLVRLGELHDQTVHFAELQGDAIVYTDKIEPRRSIRLVSRVGDNVCLYTASVAKAILAFTPEPVRKDMLAGETFERLTPTTLTSVGALEGVLEAVRERGWAYDDGEYEDYINCVGAPVRDAKGDVVAAVSVTELKARRDLRALEELVLEPLLDTAHAISLELGWQPPR